MSVEDIDFDTWQERVCQVWEGEDVGQVGHGEKLVETSITLQNMWYYINDLHLLFWFLFENCPIFENAFPGHHAATSGVI